MRIVGHRTVSFLVGCLVGAGACDSPRPEPTASEAAVKAEPASSPSAESSAAAVPPVPEHPGGEPGVRDDGTVVSAVDWFEGSLDQAQAKADAEGKLLFVDVGAYWCPPCQELDEKVFVLPKVGESLAKGYVAVHVDAEKADGPEFVEEHHVQAYPTILVLEPSGVEKGRIVDFIEADALLVALERIQNGENVLADAVEAVAAKPDDIALRQRLGHLYVLASDRKRAEVEFEQVMEADPRNEQGLASKVLYDRALFIRYKLDGDAPGAIAAFRALQEQFPDSAESVRAYRQIARLQHKLGRTDEAIATLDAMLAVDPEDTGLASSYGWLSFRQKCRPERGLEVVTAAIEKTPDRAGLHYLRAELAHLTRDDATALVAIRKASALEPKSAFFRRQVRRFEAAAGT